MREYASWALKVQYGLFRKGLITMIMDFEGQRRIVRLAPITPQAQGVLPLMPQATNLATIQIRQSEIENWFENDGDAMSHIFLSLDYSLCTRIEQRAIAKCETAYEMWQAVKSCVPMRHAFSVPVFSSIADFGLPLRF